MNGKSRGGSRRFAAFRGCPRACSMIMLESAFWARCTSSFGKADPP
jgi:hypothetical protein